MSPVTTTARHPIAGGPMRRAAVALLGLWLALNAVLLVRHRCEVDHALDVRTGELVHSEALAEHHVAGGAAHIHGLASTGDAELSADCALCSAATVSIPAAGPRIVSPRPIASVPVAIPSGTAPRRADRLLLHAPKTSPPAHA